MVFETEQVQILSQQNDDLSIKKNCICTTRIPEMLGRFLNLNKKCLSLNICYVLYVLL